MLNVHMNLRKTIFLNCQTELHNSVDTVNTEWLFWKHSFLHGWNPPFLGTPLFLKQIKKFTPLFLRAIQIGACKLYETL